MTARSASEQRVCLGVVLGAHGLRGGVKVKSFTERPADVIAYGPLEDETGSRRFRPVLLGSAPKGVVLLALEGIGDRSAAEALKGLRLWVPRQALPPPEEESFYCSDLVGLRAETLDGGDLGRVKAVFDFGGGDVIELQGSEGTRLLPFTRAVVPVVDLSGGRLVIDLPVEIEARPEEDGEDEGNGDGA